MLKKQKTALSGVVILAIFFASFATLLIMGQISMKALAQIMTGSNMTGGGGGKNASAMMVNKTAANSDVLMSKVRNMGNSTTGIVGSNMTTQGSD
jgi:hypothetical protein